MDRPHDQLVMIDQRRCGMKPDKTKVDISIYISIYTSTCSKTTMRKVRAAICPREDNSDESNNRTPRQSDGIKEQ